MTAKRIQAVIFDYDGVIADSDPFTRYAVSEALKQKGVEYTDQIYKDYFAGRKLVDSFNLLLGPLGRLQELEEFIALKKSFDSVYADHLVAYPDAIELIGKLHGEYRLVIATGSRRVLINMALKKFHLENVFELVICAEDYVKGKPDPEIYLTVLRKLSLSPGEAVVIEDTPSGIEASNAASIACVAVTHTHSLSELAGAKIVLENLLDTELESILV